MCIRDRSFTPYGTQATSGKASPELQSSAQELERLRKQLAKAHCQISALTQQALDYPVAPISPTYNGSQQVQPSAWSHQGQPKVYESQTRRYDRRLDVRPDSDNSGSQLPYRVLCFSCGEPGHYKRNCPQLNPTTSGGSYQQRSQGQKDNAMFNSRVAGTSAGRSPVYLKVKVRHRPRLCLLDSGCDTTLIPLRFVGNHHIYKTEQKCQAANGSQIPIVGSTTIPGQVGRKHVNISGLVSDHVMDLMLGIDWLQENDITWNFNKGEIYLAGETFKLRSRRTQQPYCRRVVLTENVTVPPRSQLDVPVKAVFDDIRTTEDYKSGTWGTEATELRDGLLAARTLLPDRLDDLPVRLLNTTNESIQLEKDTTISTDSSTFIPRSFPIHSHIKPIPTNC